MLVRGDEKWGQNASANITGLHVSRRHVCSAFMRYMAYAQLLYVLTFMLLLHCNLPAEEVTFAAVDSWGGQQGEAVRVTVTRTWSREADRPLAPSHRTPADGRVVLHERLQHRKGGERRGGRSMIVHRQRIS